MVQTKALYNLLRMSASEDSYKEVEDWKIENLRSFSLGELFARLGKNGLQIDKNHFFHFAEECDTPEDLTDLLLHDDTSAELQDFLYLTLFEIWRRLLPEKQSLSIFCDELDHRIALYDQGELQSDELVQDALANLLEILEQNADSGVALEKILRLISDYCAYDLEGFICDYISDLIDNGNSLYASELIEEFSPYAQDPLWFGFLRIRLVAFTNIADANIAIHRLLENELESLLLLEILRFLSTDGKPELFKIAIKKIIPLLETQEELADVLLIVVDFYHCLDEDEKEGRAQNILKNCKQGPIRPEDLRILEGLIS